MLKGCCWVSDSDYCCLLGGPFCLLSSCVIDGTSVSGDEKWCCCLPQSLSSSLSIAPPPPLSHSLSAPLCISLPPFFSSLLSHPLHLSFSLSIFAWLSVFSPALRPALSFPAKRLAGVFSTVVTFKTECHHCVYCFLSSFPLTCLSLCPLLLFCACLPHPPPAARAFWTKCCA